MRPRPSRHLSREAHGYLMVFAAAVLFSVNGTVSKLALGGGLDAARLTELRCLGAFAGLAVTLGVTRPGSLRLARREVPLLAAYGVIGVALVQWLYFVAIHRLPVGIALLFEFTAPVLIALWVRFVVRDPVRRRVWVALGLAVGGLAVVAEMWHGSRLDGLGLAAGLGAAAALAVFYLMGEHAAAVRDPLSVTCWSLGFAALFWAIVLPWWTFDVGLLRDRVAVGTSSTGPHAPLWSLVLWIVVLGTIVPFCLSISALTRLPATAVGIAGMLEPVVAGAVAWIWLHESLSVVQLIGAAVVLAGIGLAQTARPAPATATPELVG